MSDEDIFSDLVPLKPRLNDASVKANQVLKSAKERLTEIGLGVEAWVEIESEFDEATRESCTTYFGYAHRLLGGNPDFPETDDSKGPRWDLWIKWAEENPAEGSFYEEGPTPVLSCRREIRIAAARALPTLVTKLKETAEKTISDIDRAADRFC